jgi:hypothetical protein
MSATISFSAGAYSPDANRTRPEASAPPPEWLVRWLAFLIFFLMEPFNAVRMLRYRGLPACWHYRPELPPGSAQAEAAAVRGSFGNAIAWMCRRHGIGPGHPEWPELSGYILMFGGSLAKCRRGRRPRGLQWWENPYIVPGTVPGFGIPAAAPASLLEQQAVANAAPRAPSAVEADAANASHAEAAHSRLPASWLAVSEWHVFARAGPTSPTGPPNWPGPLTSITFDARGRSMASPAILIRAD